MTDDKIVYNKDGTLRALVGKDAVHLMRIQTIISGLRMSISTGGKMILTRGATPTKLLQLASEYTGKKYKRTQKQQAIDDLQIFFNNLKSSLPEETDP
jgi:hypothetical protein